MWSDWLIFCDCGFHSVFPLMEDKRLMEASLWERLTDGETGSCSDGQDHGQYILIQFSVDGWGCVPSLLFDLRPNYGGDNEDNGDLLHEVLCKHCYTQCPNPATVHHWPTPPPESPGHSRASLALSLLGLLLLSTGSGCTQGMFEPSVHLWRVWSLTLNAILPHLPSCWSFSTLGHGVSPQSCFSALQPPGATHLSHNFPWVVSV